LLHFLAAYSPAPEIPVEFDPETVRFSGDRAYEIEKEFVTTHINRVSGTKESRQATEWLNDQLASSGWNCEFDDWEIINYSLSVDLRNVVCRLPGESEKEILVFAHHDIASTTIQGADNDGSGIAILLHLAEIFAADGTPKYTLVFVADDAEEYGMIGSKRYISTHPNPENVIAGISLDNLGKFYYNSMGTDLIGQYEGYAPIWIGIAAKEAAQAAGSDWEVVLKGPIDQVLNQAVTISFTDQGPINAAGVPAIGFNAGYPGEYSQIHYDCWHAPCDNMDDQSPEALQQSGLITEALVRQLLGMDIFPEKTGPYLYFEGSDQTLSGWPLYLIFFGFVSLFFVGSYFNSRDSLAEKSKQWVRAIPHFLGLWLPLVASLLLLYIFVQVRLMDEYLEYPATTKDPAMLSPRWWPIVLFLLSMALFFYIGRWLVDRYSADKQAPEFGEIKSLAFLVIGLIGVLVLITDPFALLLLVPVLFWFLIRGRKGAGKILDVVFFLLGGLMLYALIYFFGFQILRYGIVFLWYFLNAIATGMFTFMDVTAGLAVMAAGLAMLVNLPQKAKQG
jgi:hypothetical protein